MTGSEELLSERCSVTWPTWGSMRSGVVYALPMPAVPTDASASSFLRLPTPRHEGFDAGNHRGQPDSLNQTVRMLPTPRTTEGNGTGTLETPERLDGTAQRIERLLRTPAARDGDSRGAQAGGVRLSQGHAMGLPEYIKELSLGEPTNPQSDDGSK
jgi:hypothetical protein